MYRLNSNSVKRALYQEIESLPMDGSWLVSVDPYEKGRSSAQNRYFHKLCYLIGKDTGNSKDAIKDELKLAVFGIQERSIKGQVLRELKSTAGMSTDELNTLIDAAIALAHELNIRVPLTNYGG